MSQGITTAKGGPNGIGIGIISIWDNTNMLCRLKKKKKRKWPEVDINNIDLRLEERGLRVGYHERRRLIMPALNIYINSHLSRHI